MKLILEVPLLILASVQRKFHSKHYMTTIRLLQALWSLNQN